MDTHDSADITCKVATASGDSQVFDRVKTVGVDHEITVVLISGWGLAAVAAIEELRESLLLNGVDGIHVKPRSVAGKDNGMGLCDQLLARRGFQRGLGRRGLFLSHGILKALSRLLRWLRLANSIFQSFGITLGIGFGAAHLLVLRLGIAVLRLWGGRGVERVVRPTGAFNLLLGGIVARLRFFAFGELLSDMGERSSTYQRHCCLYPRRPLRAEHVQGPQRG